MLIAPTPCARTAEAKELSSLLFPIPGSPLRMAAIPVSERRTVSHFSRSSAFSLSRPTIAGALICDSAAKRVCAMLGPRTRKVRTGVAKPLYSRPPRSLYSNQPRARRRTSSLTRTLPGSAAASSREARLRQSPVSRSRPEPTTTIPEAIPMRTFRVSPSGRSMDRMRWIISRLVRTARSASLSWAKG